MRFLSASSCPSWIPRFAAGRLCISLLLFSCFVLCLCISNTASSSTLSDADRHFAQKSYGAALTEYEAAQKSGQVPPVRKDEVAYRIAVSLGKSEKWDRALHASLSFVQTHRGTVWEARGLYWLGRLYLAVPHEGWHVGKTLTRGANVPKTNANDKPEYVDVQAQDEQNARDALEASHVLYDKLPHHADTLTEEIQLNFDLARVLEQDSRFRVWAEAKKWLPPTDPEWKTDLSTPYSLEWAIPKQILLLYGQITALAPKAHTSALALLGKALYLRGYQMQMRSQYALKWEKEKAVPIPFPYQDEKPEDSLRQIVRDFPRDPVREQARFTLSVFLEQDGKFTTAVDEFHRLIAERPNSKWVSDARAHLQAISAHGLALNMAGVQFVGKVAKFDIVARNVKSVHFAVYRVKLEDAVSRKGALHDPERALTEFPIEKFTHLKHQFGAPIAEWDKPTGDKGDYQPTRSAQTLPITRPGAYAVVATASGVRTASIVTLTDLVLVEKLSRDGILFFATDARTGAPVSGANLLIRQWYSEKNQSRTTVVRGMTNGEGLLTVPWPRKAGRTDFRVAALAWKSDNYALAESSNWQENDDNAGRFKVYATTDRAVYRPLQTVYYREVVMERKGGAFQPVAKRQLHVEVFDPAGKRIHAALTRSSEFGSVNGQFNLPPGAPLGQYSLRCAVWQTGNAGSDEGGNAFRVEEYRKPEYLVTVTPEAERVRLGQPTSVKVAAKYYFGGPVPNAKVTYRVHRSGYSQSYHFPRPYDFLYHPNEDNDSTDFRSGEVIAQGTARTDANGEAKITFPTQADIVRWKDSDLTYTVEADVQDASRRTISGIGAVKAMRHDVAVFLDFPHGYAIKGDRVDVEIMTLNSSNQPIGVEGVAKVYRQPEVKDGKLVEVYSQSLASDTHGRAILKWTASEAGYYRVAFITHDTAGEEVRGETDLWVDGPELTFGRFQYQGVYLSTQNLYYEEGGVAVMLLVTPEPNCTVLLTREANNEILDRQLVHVTGRSLELIVPLTQKDVPNVFFSAVLVRNGELFQATQELFVPPVRQLATVEVQADKTQYHPGEKASLHLLAHDWQGHPLRTELAVSINDSALTYIQKDYAPDIRLFYYGDRRSSSIEDSNSTSASLPEWGEITQSIKKYPLHPWLLPDGMGQLPDWPGGKWNSRVMAELEYQRQSESSHVVYSPTIDQVPTLVSRRSVRSTLSGSDFVYLQIEPVRVYGSSELSVRRWAYPRGVPTEFRVTGNLPAGYNGFISGISKGGYARGISRLEGRLAAPTLRSKFLDTAFWTPAVVTDAQGNATVEVTWPDNLTQWDAHAVGNTASAQVGTGETKVTTKKDLIVRLQAPRYFVEKDVMVLSANVQNYTGGAAHVKVTLELGNDCLETSTPLDTWVDVPKEGEKRVDWQVRVRHEGGVRVRMTAQSQAASDATEMSFPVLVHGVERTMAQSGVLRAESRASLNIVLPEARKQGTSELVVQLNPSLGAVMLDALPYLNAYPYGCIEQTMSRFLPSIIVAKTLRDQGFQLEDLQKRARAQAVQAKEGRGNLTLSNSPYTYPKGKPGTEALPNPRWEDPIFDSKLLKRMTDEGLAKIGEYQHEDGGWGWWKDDESDAFMSAYVVYGLLLARDAGHSLTPVRLDKGIDFLQRRFLQEDNLPRLAYEARILALIPERRKAIRSLVAGRLYDHRERLGSYSRALLALALHDLDEKSKAQIVLDNLENTAQLDEANGTVHWDDNDGSWWRWYNDPVETNATILQAYLALQPKSKMPERLVKWLVNHRQGDNWATTRETAQAVFAISDYLKATKELAPDYTLRVDLGGRIQRTYKVTRENALLFDNRFVVPDALLQPGANTLTITKEGTGACYYGAYSRYFSQEDMIHAAGSEIAVTRRYFRLLPLTASGSPEPAPINDRQPNPFLTGRYELLTQGEETVETGDTSDGPHYHRVALQPGEIVASGDLMEVELELEAKNDYDYLVFEDIKPAGCEPVEVRSGEKQGLGIYSNMELRDQKVAFFISHLPQGKRALTYRLRAETPGQFHILPTNGYAMYAPNVRALSEEGKIGVKDDEH